MATKGLPIDERLEELEKRLVDAKGIHREKILKRKATLLAIIEKASTEPIVEPVVEEEIIPAKLLAKELVSVVPAAEPIVEEPVVEEEPPVVEEEEIVEEPIPEEEPVVEEIVEEVKPINKKKSIWSLDD